MPTVALNVKDSTPGEVAEDLKHRGIIVSGGLQCAPLAHETLGTVPHGVVRFSFGPANTMEHVDMALQAFSDIAR